MDYIKAYECLISKAKNRKIEGYSESHHIVPRCLGGNDSKSNLVDLTAREHFIAHLLLVKIHKNNFKLIKAVAMMCVGQCERKITNRLYGKYRELFKFAMSEAQIGEKNSQYGTRWIHSVIEKKSVKLSKTEVLPDGWVEGRKINFDFKEIKEKVSLKKIKKEKQKEKYTEWYSLYEKVGFAEFVKITGYDKSKPNLVQNFAKHVVSFKPQNGKRRG